MAVSLTSAGVAWNDGSIQHANANAIDTGKLISIAAYDQAGTYVWSGAIPTTRSPQAVTWGVFGASIAASGSSPYTVTCSAGSALWNQAVYTNITGTYIEAKPSQTSCNFMIGLTTTPGASYTNIEYALYYTASGTIQIYENGVFVASYGTYNTTYIGRVTYDGSYIRYYCDPLGTRCLRTVAVTGKTLKGEVAFYNTGVANSVYFGNVTHDYATSAYAKVVGGGGGGAGYCESGGAGGYSEGYINVQDQPGGLTVTVGAGGVAVAYYAAGGTGGTSSFGTMHGLGGQGCNSINSHTGGRGGVGYGGALNIPGGGGTGHGNSLGAGATAKAGTSYFGSQQHFRYSSATSVGNGKAPGAGGPGNITNSAQTGMAGAPGAVIIYAYK